MAKSVKDVSEFKLPQAYELVKHEFIKEVDSYAFMLRHKKSGARILLLSNDDDNKVFSVGFRTPALNDTGTQHIIEHTVLCGSKQFPAKDPFVELVKGSMNTYLNASTYPDKTMYPVASCNEKDFENLMHVYMDAVFYPNIYEHKEIFQQEGWHYELNSPDEDIIYNGVVYNEMKGAYSSEDAMLENYLMKELYPDTEYANDSGGDPEIIPELTREEYLEYHKNYYHPVNSYIYLYGDFDLEERLNWMDEHYLGNFEKIEIDSQIKTQKHFDKIRKSQKEYAVSENEDCSKKTNYAFAALMDITLDKKICKAFEIISYVLVDMPGAPLKQALLDAKLGNDIDIDFCDLLKQSYLAVYLKNAAAGESDKIEKVIKDTLKDIVEKGIDRKILEAAINYKEFKEREADFATFPKGLLYGLGTMKTWLYDDMPFDALKYNDSYLFLREKLSTSFYEELISKYLLENTHEVLIEMNPKPGLTGEKDKQTADILDKYKKSLNEDEIADIIKQTKELKKYQEEPSPKEILEKIPVLELSDIERKAKPYINEEFDIDGIKTVFHDIHTNGIVYSKLYFDIDDLKDYIPQLSLYSTLFGQLNTENYTYTELDTETNFYTGGISSNISVIDMEDSDDYHLKFVISFKTLESNLKKTLELVEEMFYKTDFNDVKRINELISEGRSREKVGFVSGGHLSAATRALSYFSESGWIKDALSGFEYYKFLANLDDNFDKEKDAFINNCKAFASHILKKSKVIVSCTASKDGFEIFKDKIKEFNFDIDSEFEIVSSNAVKMDVSKKNEGIMTSSKVQYVALAGAYKRENYNDDGAIMVTKHILDYDYLWNNVRVKNGAYGVACRFSRKGSGFFTSFRDPKLTETLDVYRAVSDYLRDYNPDSREMVKSVIGTISGIDTPLTPNMRGVVSMMAYLMHLSYEMIQQQRDGVLDCTIEDVHKVADYIDQITNDGYVCVVGSEEVIEKNKDIFMSTDHLK